MKGEAAPYGRGLFFVAAAATAWGTGGAVAAVLYRTSGLGPVAVSFWRLVLGITVLLIVARIAGGQRDDTRLTSTIVLGIGLAVYQTAYYGAIAHVGLAIATVVTLGAGPVLVAVSARWFLAESLTTRKLLAVGGSVVGLILLVGAPAGVGANPALGVVLALTSAAGYAMVTVYGRRVGGDLANGTAAAFVVAAICVLPLALVEGLLPHLAGLGSTTGWLIYLGAVPTALAYRLFFAGLAVVPATVTAVVTLVEPVAATVIAVALLGEHLAPLSLVGAALMLAAVTLLTRE
ncbi:DME family drug/metabolite transporter [Allocatelliglobosispora scoriae]|uniref:DME family drug/metabolite transporter n=1 Tax=Allocatelliglobosispora scoriae TaxID=643052 RepID=A0A841BXY9_9ACTN|nr:DMT family transporter [Allocatelliglobosispora scoriae]MBB5872348.1 DME family drug/metabolite transporter [Allocatelliglobosispora scoriae]